MFKDRDLGYTRVCAPKGMHVISCPFAPVYTLLLNPSFCVECQTLTAFPQKNTVWSHAEMMLLARANALKHHRSCCIFLNLSNSKKHAKTTKDSKFAKTRDCSCFQTTILYRSPEDRALINAAAPTRTAVMIMNCLILEGKEKQKNMITKVTTRLRLVTSITKHQNIMRWHGGSRHYNHEYNEALDADCHDGGTAAQSASGQKYWRGISTHATAWSKTAQNRKNNEQIYIITYNYIYTII